MKQLSVTVFVLSVTIFIYMFYNLGKKSITQASIAKRIPLSNNDTTEDTPTWLLTCSDVYLDIGSNIGVQVKKFFEPSRYENKASRKKDKHTLKTVLQLYTDNFGPPDKRFNNSNLCVLGFEPNPQHQQILNNIERKYIAKGWKIHFFPYAVSVQNTFMTLYTDERYEVDVTANFYAKASKIRVKKKFTVRAISLSDFIQKKIKKIQIKLIKFDIEGSEYEVLTDLLLKGMLCKKKIKTIYMEFHDKILHRISYSLFFNTSADLLKKIKEQKNCEPTNIIVVDDESFYAEFERSKK